MKNKHTKKEAGIWEKSIRDEANKTGETFFKVAMENIKYHKKLADQGVPGGQESYLFYQNLLLRIMREREGGGEKKK